jgi:hypothetical protein
MFDSACSILYKVHGQVKAQQKDRAALKPGVFLKEQPASAYDRATTPNGDSDLFVGRPHRRYLSVLDGLVRP